MMPPSPLKNPDTTSPFGAHREGFALIVSLTLMGFVVLLALGLSLTAQIELANTRSMTQLTEARANAIFGLKTAIGQLQKELGPDQRATAPALLLKQEGNAEQSLLSDDDPRRYWVGVWDTANLSSVNGNEKTWMQAPNALHESWLISGMKDALKGKLPEINTGLGEGGEPADDSVAIMAGAGSVGSDDVDQYVFAPKVDIENSMGWDASYAYWVSDEAQKAPIALVDERYTDATTVPDAYHSRLDLMAPERVGISSLENLKGYDLTDSSQASVLEKVQNLSEAAFLSGNDLPTTAAAWKTTLGEYYHDLGVGAINLQTDVRHGGLKKDLSLLFELDDDTFAETPYGGEESTRLDAPPTDEDYVDAYTDTPVAYLFKYPVPDVAADAYIRGPTWHFLRSYYRIAKSISHPETTPTATARAYRPNTEDFSLHGSSARDYGYVSAMITSNSGDVSKGNNFVNTSVKGSGGLSDTTEVVISQLTEHEMAPLAVRLYLIFGFVNVNMNPVWRIQRDTEGDPVYRNPNNYRLQDEGPGTIIAPVIQPVAVVWNPYNTRLSFNAYKIAFNQPNLRFKVSWMEGTESRGYEATLKDLIGDSVQERMSDGTILNDDFSYFEFLVANSPDGSSPITLEPGEQKIFSANTFKHNGNILTQGEVLFLEEGWHTDGGILLHREEGCTRTFRRAGQVDNIPDGASVSVEVQWVNPDSGNPYGKHVKLVRLNGIKNAEAGLYEYVLTDTSSIAQGGNRQTDDHELRSIGASYYDSSGAQTVFNNMNPISGISPFGSNAYPFLAIEISLSPAKSGSASPMEMLGNTNPFGIIGSSLQNGKLTPDRYQVHVEPLGGPGDYSSLRPQIALDGTEDTYFGYSFSAADGSSRTVMEELPTTPLWSLGALQHANISRSSSLPRNAIGNAQSPPYFEADDLSLHKEYGDSIKPSLYDISYLSNEALFDEFFFSSLAPDYDQDDVEEYLKDALDTAEENNTQLPLPNRRFTALHSADQAEEIHDELVATDGYLKTAAYWAPKGGFNVNSTSVPAWKAFLGANYGRAYQYLNNGALEDDTENEALFSRFSLPVAETGNTSNSRDDWNAPIRLSDAQLTTLAEAVVDEVKARGPFLSLADFINRRPGGVSEEQQRQGTLARAIDQSGVNDTVAARGEVAYNGSDIESAFIGENTLKNTAAGIPGWLTQADVLTPLAPYLSVRSDTYTIRSYGEVRDPGSGTITGRAWCEAQVQRLPEYIDPDTNEPWDSAVTGNLSPTNKEFGRRFVVVSFRWLNKDEI